MKTEFTKGEWHVFLDTIQNRSGGKIAEVCTENDTCKNNWEDNAKLIAAAPDLFKALQLLVDRVENGWDTFAKPAQNGLKSAFILEAKQAIKKATQ